jgi:transcription initiation factor TFIID subunit 2
LTKNEQRVEQTQEDAALLSAAISEVERYRSMDRLIPSVHNIVTVAALEVCSVLSTLWQRADCIIVPSHHQYGEHGSD